jgi:hypothetical protein
MNWTCCLCDQIMSEIPVQPFVTLMAASGVNIFHVVSTAVSHSHPSMQTAGLFLVLFLKVLPSCFISVTSCERKGKAN